MELKAVTGNLNFKVRKAKKINGLGAVMATSIIDNKIICGLDTGHIKIYDINTQICLKTLDYHTSSVYSLVAKNGLVISCSSDNTIKVCDIYTDKCITNILDLPITGVSVAVKDNLIIAGLIDGNITVWDLNSGKLIKQIEWFYDDHCDELYTILIKDNYIISNTNVKHDNAIRIWDINTGALITKLNINTPNSINSLSVKNNIMAVATDESTVELWDTKTWQLKKTLEGHSDIVNHVYIYDKVIISCDSEAILKIWDIDTGRCVKTLEVAGTNINTLFASEDGIVFGTLDGTLYTLPIITLYNKLEVFEYAISKYNLVPYLVRELMNTFK